MVIPEVWKELTVAVKENQIDEFQYLLSSLNPRGWEETGNKKKREFKVWIPEGHANHVVQQIKNKTPEKLSVKTVKSKQWQKNWKSHFKPVKIGTKLLIIPAWEKAPTTTRIVIRINPGMGFGTGTHPTTRMCLEELEQRVKAGERWLDFGTGSGILSVAAAKFGAAEVVAVDEDEYALLSAEDNIKRNSVSDQIKLRKCNYPEFLGRYDGIIANLHTEPLALFASRFLALLKPTGVIIVSGVPKAKSEFLSNAYKRLRANVESVRNDGEWVSMVVSGANRFTR